MSEQEPTTWALGDDYFCDSCGSTWNELEFDPEGDNGWAATTRTGCYGGVQIEQNSAEEDKASFYASLKTFDNWGETEIKELRGLIAKAERKVGT